MEFKMIFTAGNGSLQTGKGFFQTGNGIIFPTSRPLKKNSLKSYVSPTSKHK